MGTKVSFKGIRWSAGKVVEGTEAVEDVGMEEAGEGASEEEEGVGLESEEEEVG